MCFTVPKSTFSVYLSEQYSVFASLNTSRLIVINTSQRCHSEHFSIVCMLYR